MFLTLEDPRAKVQGSRDPLGVQPIWAAAGRTLVTNLTTVTTSVRGFTTLLLGRYAAQRLAEDGTCREQDALAIFLRMEQVCAYVRHAGYGVKEGIRGIERVMKSLSENGRAVPIQDAPKGWILSDQKTYGLWGLFSVSARTSGLIPDGPIGVTPLARQFIEDTYWSQLKSVEKSLLKLLAAGGTLNTSLKDRIFQALAKALPEKLTSRERDFYGKALLEASHAELGGVAKRQSRLSVIMRKETDLDKPIGRATVLALAKAARRTDEELARRLLKAARMEATLAPAETFFEHLQMCNGQSPKSVADALATQWGSAVPNLDRDGFAELRPEIETVVGTEIAGVIERCDTALGSGRYEAAIEALLDWNRLVMAARKAPPWLREQSGRIDVRYRSAGRILPTAKDLPDLWRNSYFLDALKEITRELAETG